MSFSRPAEAREVGNRQRRVARSSGNVFPQIRASVSDARGALIYHVTRHVGLGFQYTYSKFRYDRETLATDLGGTLRYSGGQVVLTAAF